MCRWTWTYTCCLTPRIPTPFTRPKALASHLCSWVALYSSQLRRRYMRHVKRLDLRITSICRRQLLASESACRARITSPNTSTPLKGLIRTQYIVLLVLTKKNNNKISVVVVVVKDCSALVTRNSIQKLCICYSAIAWWKWLKQKSVWYVEHCCCCDQRSDANLFCPQRIFVYCLSVD